MNSSGAARIELLNKDNFDTWKIQMEALLIKNDAWMYVNGKIPKPEATDGNAVQISAWIDKDSKAKSDIILSINPSELKQVKGCATSRDVWKKLETIYQSKGPARKATLLKQLTLQKMKEEEDVREHIRKFFDAVDKLEEMDVTVNADLLAIMLLYSLPASFENFRCAIESRDELPSPDVLRIKIIEEYDARKNEGRQCSIQNSMMAGSHKNKNYQKYKFIKPKFDNKPVFRYKCSKCHNPGHKASECYSFRKDHKSNRAEEVGFYSVADVKSHEVFGVLENKSGNSWCLDSGSTSHLCKSSSNLMKIESNTVGKINLASHATTEIKAKGIALLKTSIDGKTKNVTLNDTLQVPDLRTNLISVGKVTDKGFRVIFDKDGAVVVDKAGNVKVKADRVDGLYYVRGNGKEECNTFISKHISCANTKLSLLETWHRRLGHLNLQDLREAVKTGAIKGLKIGNIKEDLECEVCLSSKMSRPTFPKRSVRKTEPCDLIHSDVCGPMRTQSNGKAVYFVTFIDDCTRWSTVRFLQKKSDVIREFKDFRALIETQQGRRIKMLQSDNGKEYVNSDFDEYLKRNGIQRRLTAPHNPEQNGIAERKNRSLVETARCLLTQSDLPPSFWAEAISTANYIRNRCPTSVLSGRTPYEAWKGEIPDVSGLREFGNEVYCLNRSINKGKFEPRSRKGVFVGYSEESKAYRIWIRDERKIEITRDVKFMNKPTYNIQKNNKPENHRNINENDPENEINTKNYMEFNLNQSSKDYDREEEIIKVKQEEEIESESVVPSSDQPENILKRGSGRPRRLQTGQRGRPRKIYRMVSSENQVQADLAFLSEVPLNRAMSSLESGEWMEAMASEFSSILKNDTWDLEERPDGQGVIGSRIVLRNKYGSEGTPVKRKARVVARGFSQRPGLDYHETFSPVARLSSIRTVAALAAQHGMHMRQFDIVTAYLNGILEEDIYMEIPTHTKEILEYIVQKKSCDVGIVEKARKMLKDMLVGSKVCHMKKALYGLRQAGRSWNKRLDTVIKKFGAIPSKSDPCMYVTDRDKRPLLIVVYVDDIIVSCQDTKKIDEFGNHLKRAFEVKDLGILKNCLGVRFDRDQHGITISQANYIEDILERFGMSDCKPVSTPIAVGSKLTKSDIWSKDDGEKPPYKELVGSLMYLAVATRPDISHASSLLGQFGDCFGKSHWLAAKRVLRYLKKTKDVGITFHAYDDKLKAYVDADWGACPDDRRSFTGYAFVLNGGVVSWESKKQRTVALSTVEAEYMALGEASKEAVYLKKFLGELGFEHKEAVKIYVDNAGAQKLAGNPVFHARTKHIDIRHHFVREALEAEQIELEHVPTEDMGADVLTKGLPKQQHLRCLEILGISRPTNYTACLEGDC